MSGQRQMRTGTPHTQVREKLAFRPHFAAPKMPHTSFIVQHYAGEVLYSTDGFVDSNRDILQPALIDLMLSSTSAFVQALFTDFGETDSQAHSQPAECGDRVAPGKRGVLQRAAALNSARTVGGKGRGGPSGRSTIIFTSVTSQFRSQLGALVSAISLTSPHFVRCINPNTRRSPTDFDTMSCLEQLRCGGVMDAVHVTRSGFGSRYLYPDFIARFHCCAPKAVDAGDGSPPQRAAALIRAMGLREDIFQLGKTRCSCGTT